MKNAEKRAVQRPADLPSAFCAEISFLRHLIAGPDPQTVPYRQGFLKWPRRSWGMTAFLMPLRDGRFLTPRVLRVYPLMLMAGFAAAILFLGFTAHGMNDYAGRPLGT